MLAKGGTVTYTTTDSSDNEAGTAYIVVAVDGWREVTVDDLETIEIKEPAQKQDEPDMDERPVTWERPNRRLATVTGLRRLLTRIPQQASTYG